MSWAFDHTILGQCPSAKNARRIVKFGNMPRLIKSEKALQYVDSFNSQCPVLDPLLEGDVVLWVDSFYQSRRPDLACMELLMDLLQGKVYANDRSVKVSGSSWNLDKENPRVRIRVRSISSESSTEMSSLDPSEIWGVEITGKLPK
jgi:hypothetical protein